MAISAPNSQLVRTADAIAYDARQAAAARQAEQDAAYAKYDSAWKALNDDLTKRQNASQGLLLDPGSIRPGMSYGSATPSLRQLMDATGMDTKDASEMLYGIRGANVDARNWGAILNSGSPQGAVKNAFQATSDMYGGFRTVDNAFQGDDGRNMDALVSGNTGNLLRSYGDNTDFGGWNQSNFNQFTDQLTPEQYQQQFGHAVGDTNAAAPDGYGGAVADQQSKYWANDNPLYRDFRAAETAYQPAAQASQNAQQQAQQASAFGSLAPGMGFVASNPTENLTPGTQTWNFGGQMYRPSGASTDFGSLAPQNVNRGPQQMMPGSWNSGAIGSAPYASLGQPQGGFRSSPNWGGPWGANNGWRVSA